MLDSVRAVAITMVFVYHAFPGRRWSDALNVGVAIFFALSGFLLYRPHLHARAHGARAPRARTYAVRRALRILPAYWVALAIVIAFGLYATPAPWQQFLLIQIYAGHGFDGLVTTWSLCVEAAFYVALPFFAWGVGRWLGGRFSLRGELLALGTVAAVSVAIRAVGDAAPSGFVARFDWMPAGAAWFAAGMAVAALNVAYSRGALVRGRELLVNSLPWWTAACAGLVVLTFVPRNVGTGATSVGWDLVIYALSAVIAGCVLIAAVFGSQTDVVSRILKLPIVAWLGLISYGLFLWQAVAIVFVRRHLPQIGVYPGVAVAAVVTVACAAASYYLVERLLLARKP